MPPRTRQDDSSSEVEKPRRILTRKHSTAVTSEPSKIQSGWYWTSPQASALADGRPMYTSAELFSKGKSKISVSVGDLVLTQVDPDDPSTKVHKLRYWVGQIGALWDNKKSGHVNTDASKVLSSEPEMSIRFFECPAAWQRQTKSTGVHFRWNEMIETDLCEVNPLDIIVKRVPWLSAQDVLSSNHEDDSDSDDEGLPTSIYSDRMLVKCGSDGKLKAGQSDQLWPAPLEKRADRLWASCAESRIYGERIFGQVVLGQNQQPLAGIPKPKSKSKKRTAIDSVTTPTVSFSNTGYHLNPNGASSGDVFQRAAYHLQLSVVPEQMPCRDSERSQIESFLGVALKTEGCTGNVFYISGMPGTGKTATVLGVVKKFSSNYDFKFIHINALKLNTPNDIYNELCSQMGLRRGVGQAAVDRLDNYFSNSGREKTRWLLLLDEIDYLVTKSQTVCYKLFDWPTLPHSKLAIIAISNTMDLPERMIPRVASRLGLNRLNFLPYNRDQIKEVLVQRLVDANAVHVFEEAAIQLCAMRVASSSGDVRKALQVLRRAVEIRKGDKVTSMDTNNAQQDLQSNVFTQAISSSPLLLRRAIAALYLSLKRSDVEATTIRKMWSKFSQIVNEVHSPENHARPKTFKDFSLIVRQLEEMAIITVKPLTKQVIADFNGSMDYDKESMNAVKSNEGKKVQKAVTIDKENDDDEDGALMTVSFNGMMDIEDAKFALLENSKDHIATKLLSDV